MISEKRRVALSSVLAAVLITGLKLVVGLQTNSLGILSEAAHSGLDLMAAVLTYLAVTVADRPPDREHHYGHGKIENVSALLQTILLFVTCAWIIWEALERLVAKSVHVDANLWAFLVMATSVGIDVSRSRALSRAARRYHSQALEADALHFASDVWSSLVVIAGLVLVQLGYPWMDAAAAVIVALLVLFVSYRLGRRTIDALMDRVPEGLYERIVATVRQVEGVEGVQSMRLRSSGATVFVDATVAIRRTTPFPLAHHIMDRVEQAIHEVYSLSDVVVHAEPEESRDETIGDKVRMIVVGKGLRAPHNVEVQESNGRYHIDLDVEYQKGKPFVEAHDLASEIERDIRSALGAVETVTIHMEEYRPGTEESSNVTASENRLLDDIQACVLADSRILQCSDLHLLRLGDRFNLALNCVFDKESSLEQVHQIVSETEMRLHGHFPMLRRVTIHAEPSPPGWEVKSHE